MEHSGGSSVLDALFGGEPSFERRCYLLDVSRDRVPTLETLGWLIDVLAALRYNELQLYIEHTFAFAGHDMVWEHASPYTRSDLSWIRARAAGAGIDLVVNTNTFGHMERWLRHDAYRDRAECPAGAPGMLGNSLRPPGCLAPTGENATFATQLVRELHDVVGGNRVMVGGDEPFELGRGVSSDMVARRGRGDVYRRHLGDIMRPLIADGLEVMFWGDQFRRDPDSVAWIPAGATCVVWNYEAPAAEPVALPRSVVDALGLPDDAHLGCAAHARLLIESTKPFWVACGTSSWNTLIGRNQNAAANIADTASVGHRGGANGFMVADWGDNGHWQPLAVSLPSIVRGAVAAWSAPDDGSDVDVGPVVDEVLAAEPGTGALIDRLGNIGESLGAHTTNGSPVCGAVISLPFPTIGTPDQVAVEAALDAVQHAITRFDGVPIGGPRGAVIAAELAAICRVALIGLRRLAGHTPDEDEIDSVVAAQRNAWLGSSRHGGLSDSLLLLTR